jgi:hypothetical protein
MRGFRPGYFRVRSDDDEDTDHIKQNNMLRYMCRVREGRPIFEADQADQSVHVPQPSRWE